MKASLVAACAVVFVVAAAAAAAVSPSDAEALGSDVVKKILSVSWTTGHRPISLKFTLTKIQLHFHRMAKWRIY